MGAWGLAVPIRDSKRNVVAGIGLAGPTSLFSDDLFPKYLDILRQTAGKIEAVMRGPESGKYKIMPGNLETGSI